MTLPYRYKKPPSFGTAAFPLFLGIGLFLVGSTQEIVYTDIVEICQGMENGNRNIQSAQLIIRVSCLMDFQKIRKVFLLQIPVFPQVTQTILIHNNHPELLCIKGYSLIAF